MCCSRYFTDEGVTCQISVHLDNLLTNSQLVEVIWGIQVTDPAEGVTEQKSCHQQERVCKLWQMSSAWIYSHLYRWKLNVTSLSEAESSIFRAALPDPAHPNNQTDATGQRGTVCDETETGRVSPTHSLFSSCKCEVRSVSCDQRLVNTQKMYVNVKKATVPF